MAGIPGDVRAQARSARVPQLGEGSVCPCLYRRVSGVTFTFSVYLKFSFVCLRAAERNHDVHVAKSLCDVAKATCEVASGAGQLLGSSELIDMEVETPLLPLGVNCEESPATDSPAVDRRRVSGKSEKNPSQEPQQTGLSLSLLLP